MLHPYNRSTAAFLKAAGFVTPKQLKELDLKIKKLQNEKARNSK